MGNVTILNPHRIKYTIERLLTIAGVRLNLYRVDGRRAAAIFSDCSIEFTLANKQKTQKLFSGLYRMGYIQSFDNTVSVPLMLDSGEFIKVSGSTMLVEADIITLSFLLLSRFEETLTDRRDKYGRFSYENSLARKYGFIHIPIVDEYAMLLRKKIKAYFPSILLDTQRNSNLIPTHDVDELCRFRGGLSDIKSIVAGDLIIRKSLVLAKESARILSRINNGNSEDPYYEAVKELIKASKKNDLKSVFYFMGSVENDSDYRYSCDSPQCVTLMEKVKDAGMFCGFHGGLTTYNDLSKFTCEKECLDRTLGEPSILGRQHYLCFDAMKTPRIWETCRIRHDSSLCFYDHEGFMCGTSHPYPLYDIAAEQTLQVIEHPLLLMDVTVQGYRRLSIEITLALAKQMLNRVVAFGGDFVILWHNTSVGRDWSRWYQQFYLPFIAYGGIVVREETNSHENI